MTRRKRAERSDTGNTRATGPEVATELAPFRERVLAVVRQIPAGRVTTYGTVSLLAGHPRAARQVGGVLYGLRHGETDVPWHRVINAEGGISTFKVGSGELQVALLESEGVVVNDRRVDLGRYLWRPDPEDDV